MSQPPLTSEQRQIQILSKQNQLLRENLKKPNDAWDAILAERRRIQRELRQKLLDQENEFRQKLLDAENEVENLKAEKRELQGEYRLLEIDLEIVKITGSHPDPWPTFSTLRINDGEAAVSESPKDEIQDRNSADAPSTSQKRAASPGIEYPVHVKKAKTGDGSTHLQSALTGEPVSADTVSADATRAIATTSTASRSSGRPSRKQLQVRPEVVRRNKADAAAGTGSPPLREIAPVLGARPLLLGISRNNRDDENDNKQ